MPTMSLKRHHREAILSEVRRWIGTPYHHQASCIGSGVDCIGLVRGVWRHLYGSEPQKLPGYGRDWSEASGNERMLDAARRHFREVAPSDAMPGDVLIFRYRPGYVAKHAGILSRSVHGLVETGTIDAAASRIDDGSRVGAFIHAAESAPVAEVPLVGWWRKRIVAAFQFPGVID